MHGFMRSWLTIPRAGFFIVASLVLLPATSFAQATLAGTVQDASGAVLPGVTVEIASPVLIEKVRSSVTDGSGQYRITELRPGAYSMTFTLPGFTTVKREEVNVSGIAVITINAEMRVGGVQETITVTGETPIVDVQSTRRQAVLDNQTVNEVPASRGYGNLLMAVAGVQVNLLNSATDPTMQFFTSNGGRSNEGRVQIDGLNVGSAFNGGGVSSFAYDTANVDEVQISVSGGMGEADIGGPALNIIPRTGGNVFHGTAFFSNAGEWSQGSNLDDELRAAGITENPALIKSWDTSFSMGGPILRDRLWFFGMIRTFGNHTDNAGLYGNANVGDASRWDYLRDAGVKSRAANDKKVYAGRLTGQLTPRNKVGFYYDYQWNCGGSTLTEGAGGCRERGDDWVALGNFFGITSPESGTMWDDREKIIQATYSSPLTNKLLLEAGYSTFISRWGGQDPGGALTSFIPVTEQSGIYGRTNWTYRGLDGRFGQRPVTARLAGVDVIRHRVPCDEVRYPGRVSDPQRLRKHRHQPADLPLQQPLHPAPRRRRGNGLQPRERHHHADAESVHDATRRTRDDEPDALPRVLRAGPVDGAPAHATGRAALRVGEQLGARGERDHQGFEVQRRADRLRPDAERRWLSRHLTAVRRGLRRVRQRQDRAQGQPRSLPGQRQQRRQLHHQQPGVTAPDQHHAQLDRCQRQLRHRLRADESRRAGPSRHRRRQLRRVEYAGVRRSNQPDDGES